MIRVEAGFAALKVLLAADYARATRALVPPTASARDRSVQEMVIVSEVACALTVSEHTAGALLGESEAPTARLPLTLKALQAGTISWEHARAMVDETVNLGPAGDLVPHRFRSKVRTWRERHHPDSIEKRHTKSAKDRRVEFRPDSDGMAWFSAYLPADTAAGIWDRTTAAAHALEGPAETRTLTQLRADVAATLLLTTGTDAGTDADADGNGNVNVLAGDVPVPRAQVLITVPVLSLLGATEEPAMLDGHGPIPPSMARRLVAAGADSFHRVLVDPRDGAPLEIGRASYRLTKGACASGSGSATADARSRAATTPPWTTTQTTSWPGPTAAPPGSTTSASPAANTTGSNTPPPGPRAGPARTNHPAGPHRQGATIPANSRTGNHPTGHPGCCTHPG